MMNRRILLENTLKGLSSLPFLSLGKTVVAAENTPKRFVLFYTHQGAVTDTWQLAGESQVLTADLLHENVTLYPLANWAQYLTVIDGVALVSGERDGNANGFRHETSAAQILTGSMTELLGGVPIGTQKSLDQVIAENIALDNQFLSLEWGVGTPFNSPCYLMEGLNLPPLTNPQNIFHHLQGAQYNITISDQQGNFEEFDNHFGDLSRGLSDEDIAQLEAHQEMLQEWHQRDQGISTLKESCDFPEEPENLDDYNQDFTEILSLLQLAFSCDLARVISLNMGQLPMTYLRESTGNVHAELAHNIFNDPIAYELMTQYNVLHANHFAALLEMLANTTDPLGNGESLLENTLILWISNLGDGSHCYNDLPVIVAGGGHFSTLKMGHYIRLTETSPVYHWNGGTYSNDMGVPHQRLLNSIALQFGIDEHAFDMEKLVSEDGDILAASGVIAEILT